MVMHSALQRELATCVPPVTCHVFEIVYKIETSKAAAFSLRLVIWKKVKYKFHEENNLHHALKQDLLPLTFLFSLFRMV